MNNGDYFYIVSKDYAGLPLLSRVKIGLCDGEKEPFVVWRDDSGELI